MPEVIPLSPPKPLSYDAARIRPLRVAVIRVCALCEFHYQAWQSFKAEFLYHRHGRQPLKDTSLEEAERLWMLFRSHVLQCRVVASSLGERTTLDECEEFNRRSRDVQQSSQRAAWLAQHGRVEA